MSSDDKGGSGDSTLVSSGYGPLPSFTNQKFLSVHVKKGSNTTQIANAVATALKSHDVPFFKDRTIDPSKPVPTPTVQQPSVGGAGADGNADDGDGLLILVQQEGGP